MRTVNITELVAMFDHVVKKLEFENIEEIEINCDYYRFIPTNEWETFEKDVIHVGSLEDDIDSLKLLINDPERPCMYIDFDRISSVLRAISQINNPPDYE